MEEKSKRTLVNADDPWEKIVARMELDVLTCVDRLEKECRYKGVDGAQLDGGTRCD